MDPKSKEFLALQREWYKKIADLGFHDIESEDHRLTSYHSSKLMPKNYQNLPLEALETNMNAKREYYRLATHFLNDSNDFSSEERRIWELHSEGTSYRDICKILNSEGYKGKHSRIWSVISKLKDRMVKFYRGKVDE